MYCIVGKVGKEKLVLKMKTSVTANMHGFVQLNQQFVNNKGLLKF